MVEVPPSKGKRPRDYVTAYFRRILEEPDFLEGVRKMRAASGTWNVLPSPLNKMEWEDYLKPSNSAAKPWLKGTLLERFREAAESIPDNPEYKMTYGRA